MAKKQPKKQAAAAPPADDIEAQADAAAAAEPTNSETSVSQAYLAKKLETRTLAEPAKPAKLSDEAAAKKKLREETRARLDEIHAELTELEAAKRALMEEQGELANPASVDDGMTFIERLRQVQARTTENRERRVRDRLKLLAVGAGKSPLDQAMGDGKRKSQADADADPAAKE